MPVKAKTVVDLALRLLSHVNAAGAVDENRESRYYGTAPAYLTVLQVELARAEGSATQPGAVQSLDDPLNLRDETAYQVMPAGLAMYFALIDRDTELYNHFSRLYYGSFLPSVKADETRIEDYYNVGGDPTFQ